MEEDIERTEVSVDEFGKETLIDEDVSVAGSSPPKTLERGQELGRYVVMSRIGSGGMGIVYEAYDPELNRRLAIKLLHPLRQARNEEKAREHRMRLLREAQAMARLSHPNVITVHDVGPYEDGVFVAKLPSISRFCDTSRRHRCRPN